MANNVDLFEKDKDDELGMLPGPSGLSSNKAPEFSILRENWPQF